VVVSLMVLQIQAQDIYVGNIVWLRENDEVPCDLVLVGTSDPQGVCYVEVIKSWIMLKLVLCLCVALRQTQFHYYLFSFFPLFGETTTQFITHISRTLWYGILFRLLHWMVKLILRPGSYLLLAWESMMNYYTKSRQDFIYSVTIVCWIVRSLLSISNYVGKLITYSRSLCVCMCLGCNWVSQSR